MRHRHYDGVRAACVALASSHTLGPCAQGVRGPDPGPGPIPDVPGKGTSTGNPNPNPRVIKVMMERLACHVGLVSNSHNQEDFSGGGTRVFYSNVSNGNSLVGGPEFF